MPLQESTKCFNEVFIDCVEKCVGPELRQEFHIVPDLPSGGGAGSQRARGGPSVHAADRVRRGHLPLLPAIPADVKRSI